MTCGCAGARTTRPRDVIAATKPVGMSTARPARYLRMTAEQAKRPVRRQALPELRLYAVRPTRLRRGHARKRFAQHVDEPHATLPDTTQPAAPPTHGQCVSALSPAARSLSD
jgi:hypothetical protein